MVNLFRASFESVDAEEAVMNAKEAVRLLSDDKSNADSIVLTGLVSDSQHPLELPHQAVYERVARNAGFVAQAEVRPDRRGYLHLLIFRRWRSAPTDAVADRSLSLI